MKYKLTIAVAIVAALVLSVIPMVSDDSDAYVVKDSESAVGYTVKGLSDEDLKKILPEDIQLDYAHGVMVYLIQDDYTHYDYTEVKVSEYKASEYWGSSTANKEQNRVGSWSYAYKITFKATCNTAVEHDLFFNEYQYESVIKDAGRDNQSKEGAVFEISAYVEYIDMEHSKIKYDYNSLGQIFVTHDNTKTYIKETLKADVKYTVGGKTTSYSVDIGSENSGRYDVTMDFGDVAMADVTNTTRVLMETKADQEGGLNWNRVKFDDKEVGPFSYTYNPDPDVDLHAYRNVRIIEHDIGPQYAFYSNDITVLSMFSGTQVDESLRSDEALKQFFADKGSVMDTFGDVEKGADSLYQDMTFSEDLKQVGLVIAAAFGAFIVTVIVIVVVIMLIKRKK